MSKLVYISSIAAPHQIKLCEALNKYMETEFWFYEHINANRPSWWEIPLCIKCKVLDKLILKKNSKYLTFDVIKKLNEYNPDIVMVGGFSIPSNYLAYRWAKQHNKKTIVFTELSRDKEGKLRSNNFIWKSIRYLYRNVDYIFTSNADATRQFSKDLRFGNKVITTRYASDLDNNFKHAYRIEKDAYTFLFANRLVDIYNPLLAIDIFAGIQKKYNNSKLLLNNQGPLKNKCIEKIKKYKIEDHIEFLADIKSWDDLPKVYERSDILIFPALFSNGNFSIYEAMASGMGIVISDKINGHTDVLENNKNCFIVKPEKEIFLHAIENYIKQPDLFKRHADINRRLIQPLSIDGTAEFIYETLIHLNLAEIKDS